MCGNLAFTDVMSPNEQQNLCDSSKSCKRSSIESLTTFLATPSVRFEDGLCHSWIRSGEMKNNGGCRAGARKRTSGQH